ncbi:hypothetical protein DM02DRAFT_659175 [Periconia macrospinosa]|uniref:Uncharacterized protein n=1 Tax=Periconia macrospinosa TaxID=97972 RepID=A0A2V1DHA2_9PLEO|nr:hypothetical protein DM02DRAFT_659175 [Periconia macrospinosa]
MSNLPGANSAPASPQDVRSRVGKVDVEDSDADVDMTLAGEEDAEPAEVDEDMTLVGGEGDDDSESSNEDSDDGSEPTPGAYRISVRPEGIYYVGGPIGNGQTFHHVHVDTDEEIITDAEGDSD